MPATVATYTPDPAAILALVESRHITRRQHPTADLQILNYTPRTQFDRLWNAHTLHARGLIVDGLWNVVARPFPKFFNLDEHEGPLPDEPFEVYDKADGSLGILYRCHERWAVATRGAFSSEQAQVATALLHARYPDVLPRLDPALTYLTEIIYPANRIVVDYGEREALVLLAVVETATGRELPLDDFAGLGFPLVEHFGIHSDLAALRAGPQAENREGYVLRFRSGLRLKLKFADYVRLHRLLTGLNTTAIWECLKNGLDVNDLIDGCSEAAKAWAHAETDALLARFRAVEDACRAGFVDHGDRKANALAYQSQPYPAVLFRMLDGRPYDDIIWKLVRPERSVPFAVDLEG